MTSITDIAASIRKHSPGVLPDEVLFDLHDNLIIRSTGHDVPLPDHPAALILIAAMVMDANLERLYEFWVATKDQKTWDGIGNFPDSDHGGPLGSAYAAWRWAKGISD